MGKAEGFNFIETLTGFKWMGNKSYELLKQDKKVIFAFEEAIGFMCGSEVLDKDGINAAVNLCTMATYLYHHSLTLSQQLKEIYEEYGYHLSHNSYFICRDADKIKKIFERLRNFNGPNTVSEFSFETFLSSALFNRFSFVSFDCLLKNDLQPTL